VAASKRLTELMDIRAQLETWSCSLTADSSAPMYWRLASGDTIGCNNTLLWFRDLSVANVYTHLWSFQVTCISQIRNLLLRYPELERFETAIADNTTELRDAYIELCIDIFKSMEYLLQEEFMLYGLCSVWFPLCTACKALEMDEEGRAVLQKLDLTVTL
jgi:hypothetical protein